MRRGAVVLGLVLASGCAAAGSSGSNSSTSGATNGSSTLAAAASTGSGSSSASTGSSSATASSTSSSGSTATSTAGSSSGGSTCTPDSDYAGPGNGAQCCSGSASPAGFCLTVSSSGSTAGSSGSGGSLSSSGASTSGSSGATSGGDVCSTQRCTVYAQTPTDLYSLDPVTHVQTHLCAFGGLLAGQQVYDIAVRSDGVIYADTPSDLYQVDPSNCIGTHVANLGTTDEYNALTFTASGALLATSIGTGNVVEIDPTTGNVALVGSYGNGLASSGDMVALSDGTLYGTATSGIESDAGLSDFLVTLDPNNGYSATIIGRTGFSQIWGLAYWSGTLYGFDSIGEVSSIDPITGIGTLIGLNPTLEWYGAGTTPRAPLATP